MEPIPARTPAALAFGLALALSGCAAAAGTSPAGTPSAAASASSSAPASSAAEATPPPSNMPAAGAAAQQGLATFTFPDGRTSFSYPAPWTVDVFHAAGAQATSATATVKDPAGRRMATVYIGQVTDAVTTPAVRTVYESTPVPGLAALPAPAAHVSWYRDDSGGASAYRLHLTAGPAAAGEGMSLDGIIRAGGGVLVAEVVWDSPTPFASEEAAEAWYASQEGQQVRALLTSIAYS